MIYPELLDRLFDEQLYSVSKGLTHEKMDKGLFLVELEKIKEWKNKNGYTFNIYGNDHLIDGKPHFHFDHKEKGIVTKINLDGEVVDSKGRNDLSSKSLKEIKYFLKKNRNRIVEFWNQKNPTLQVK